MELASFVEGSVRCRRSAGIAVACLLFELGCAPAADDASQDAAARADAAAEREGCTAPEGVSARPHTVADAVRLINALQRPVTLPCFIEALERPLPLQAVNSQVSAQPAQGVRSPRVFIFFEDLILSVVLDGPGAALLEFGEARGEAHSLKAELEFPVETELGAAAPYERLPYNENITTCGFCHQGEFPDPDVDLPWAMTSPALRPGAEQRVSLDVLLAEASACDAKVEPERCALLRALVSQGPAPVDHDFPESYATFF